MVTDSLQLSELFLDYDNVIMVYIKYCDGLDNLMNIILSIAESIASPSESPQITRERHRIQIENAIKSLNMFILRDNDLVLAAEDLRMTIRYLSNITGNISVEDILDDIFANFCIGK